MSAKNEAAAAPLPSIDVGRSLSDMWHDSLQWLSDHSLQIVIAAAVGTAIAFALWGLRGLGKRLCRKEDRTGWRTIIGRAIAKTNSFFIVMVSAKLVAGYAQTPLLLAQTISFLFTLAAVFQAAIWARELILGVVEHRAGADAYHAEALGSAMGIIRLLVTLVLFAIALIVVLDNLGVNVTGLVAGLGIGGIAIGLAAQGIFSDLFAALSILFDKPFRRGDAITYDQTSGTVESIGLKTTRIRGLSGEERIISNAKLLEKEIQNNTRRLRRRYKFVLGATYETNPGKLRSIPDLLKEIVEGEGYQFIRSGFVAFNASSLDFEVEFESESQSFEDGYLARHRVGLAILERFNEDGISFAYPTQTSFTAAPDGTLVMPYPDETKLVTEPAKEPRRKAPAKS